MMPLRWYAQGAGLTILCSLLIGVEISSLPTKTDTFDAFMGGMFTTFWFGMAVSIIWAMVKDVRGKD